MLADAIEVAGSVAAVREGDDRVINFAERGQQPADVSLRSRLAGADGRCGRWAKLGFRLVISYFADYTLILELDREATSLYICTATMIFRN